MSAAVGGFGRFEAKLAHRKIPQPLIRESGVKMAAVGRCAKF
jgi:hypothetical protein